MLQINEHEKSTKLEEKLVRDEHLVWGNTTHVWSTQKVSYPEKIAYKIGMLTCLFVTY